MKTDIRKADEWESEDNSSKSQDSAYRKQEWDDCVSQTYERDQNSYTKNIDKD